MAAEIRVDDDDGTKDYDTIQGAVDAAGDYDTILVYPGTYNENVNVDIPLNITSTDGASVTHVTADVLEYPVFDIESNNVTINGFNISGTTHTYRGSITLDEVEYCNITNNNISNSDNGIFIRLTSKNNNLVDNHVSGNTKGIYLWYTYYNNLTNNVVTRNNNGIYLESSEENELIDNTILDNVDNGIYLKDSYDNNLHNNNVSGNNKGICMYSPKDFPSDNNFSSNTVFNNVNEGIFLQYPLDSTLTDNSVYNNSEGIVLQYPQDSTLTDNTVFNNTGSGITLDDDGDHEVRNENNTLIDNTVLNNNKGIDILYVDNTTLIGNTVLDNNNGIWIDKCYYNNLTGNNVSNNTDKGIYLFSSHHNNLVGNNVLENCVFGIYQNIGGLHLTSSNYNFIEYNNISYNGDNGIYMDGYNTGCGNNNLSGNILSNNGWYGISLKGTAHYIYNNTISNNGNGGIYLTGEGNYIYNNYFNNDIRNAYISGAPGTQLNTTNNTGPNIIGGPYIGGNFWATPDGTGFSQVNTDSDGDGFCDSPNSSYELSNGNIDYLPLAGDSTEPSVVPIAPLGKEVVTGELLELNVSVKDDSDIFSVVVNVSSVNDTVDTAFLTNVNGYWVNNSITLDVNPHGEYNLSINATDEFGNSNTSMNLSVIGESTSAGDGNEDDGGSPVYHPQPLFDVPTANPLLLVGVLGIVVMFFVRRRE
ncbi:VPXXXP-CTERM sorting domain-containing protein [Methanohalophilus portucalensis FDF-1]|nr:VPXXXP-CTERM sorting domain-containing protein [Methanohalophilus portucalensis FDF-1]